MASTPAKKSAPTLNSLLGKDNDNKEEKNTTPVEDKPDTAPDLPIGPDNDKDDVHVDVDNKEDSDNVEKVNHDFDGSQDRNSEKFRSDAVVHSGNDKTPAEMAAETPDETVDRYGIDTSITDEDADNPRVQVYRDTHVNQVPSGTHLHPDIAKDLLNRGISEQHTDNAQVKRTITDSYDFAPDADLNDKF